MRAALGRRNIVYERKYAFDVTVGMLHCEFYDYSVLFGFAVNGQIVEFGLAFVKVQNVIDDTAVVFERLGIEFVVVAKIRKFYRKSAVEKREFAKTFRDGFEIEFDRFEYPFIGFESNESSRFRGFYARIFKRSDGVARNNLFL